MRASGTVWRALELARRANLAERGAPGPIAGPSGQTRRSVLKALGAAGVAGLMPVPAAALPRGGRVAIVGAGIAGLSARHHLTKAGIEARVFEARSRVGGRMFTSRTFEGGRPLEEGAQLVNSDHEDIRGLCSEFGIGLVDRKETPHRAIILSDGHAVSEEALAGALRAIAAQIGEDSVKLDSDYAVNAPRLDRWSAAQYLDAHAALLPQPWVRNLLEMTIRTEFGAEPGEASALELIFNLPTVDGRAVEILGESDERFVIEGGSGTLPAALAARYGDAIELGRRLARIDPYRDGVRLSFLDGGHADADFVILAVPAPLTRTIGFGVPLPAAWRRFIGEMRLGRNEKLHVAAAARPWMQPMGYGGELWQTDPGQGFALGWDGGIGPKEAPGSIWTWFVGGAQASGIEQGDLGEKARRFAASVEAGVPGLAASFGAARRTGWWRDPLTLGAYSVFGPGQLTRNASLFWIEDDDPAEAQAAVAGRVLFAGEHLSDAFAGFMNGAAQTGRLAAAWIAAHQSVRRAA